jgi:hypothetical protein
VRGRVVRTHVEGHLLVHLVGEDDLAHDAFASLPGIWILKSSMGLGRTVGMPWYSSFSSKSLRRGAPPSRPGGEAAQVRVTLEQHAEEVVTLALLPVGRRPDVHHAGHRRVAAVQEGLEDDAVLLRVRIHVVNDHDLLEIGVIDPRDALQVVEGEAGRGLEVFGRLARSRTGRLAATRPGPSPRRGGSRTPRLLRARSSAFRGWLRASWWAIEGWTGARERCRSPCGSGAGRRPRDLGNQPFAEAP